MKTRQKVLLIIAGLLFILVVYLYFFQPTPREAPVVEVQVVVAREGLDTYSLVSGISAFKPVTRSVAAAVELYKWAEFLDLVDRRALVTTRLIFPDDLIAYQDILPIGDREFRPGESESGIISIYVPTDKIMGGKVRPGVRLDIYGYLPESGQQSADTLLVATNVWVVDVHSASGEEVLSATPPAGEEERGGLLSTGARIERTVPANILTLAADLSTVDSIVYWLGAKGYAPWVVMSPLTAGGSASSARRTPVAPPTRMPPASPTPEVSPATPTPVFAATTVPSEEPTPTEGSGVEPGRFRLHMSAEEDGASQTDYPENTGVVYAVVSWSDVPQTAIRVRAYFATTGNWILDVTDVVEGTGSKSYEMQDEGEFDPGPYLTFLYAEPGLSVLDMVWWMVDTTTAVGGPEFLPETGYLDNVPDHFRGP